MTSIYPPPRNPSRTARATVRATALFWRMYRRAKFKALLAALTAKSRELKAFSDLDLPRYQIATTRQHVAVRLEQITGTQGRLDDYDCDWLPRHRRDVNRWVGVCVAMLKDMSSLPPVELVQADDEYYVKNGNHRISVAIALDYIFIDAHVTVWESRP